MRITLGDFSRVATEQRGTHSCARLSPAPQLLPLPSLSQKSGFLSFFLEVSLNKQPVLFLLPEVFDGRCFIHFQKASDT